MKRFPEELKNESFGKISIKDFPKELYSGKLN